MYICQYIEGQMEEGGGGVTNFIESLIKVKCGAEI